LQYSNAVNGNKYTSKDRFISLTRAGAIMAGLVASSLIAYQLHVGPQYETANSIPNHVLKDKKEIYGKIVHVTDGDTYSFRHLPSIFSSESYSGRSRKQNTITIRIAAVDTPELAKGNSESGQEYSEEARDFAVEKLMGNHVRIRCLGRDQYGRLLGRVYYKDKAGGGVWSLVFGDGQKDISQELLRRGLAVVYRSGGAKYDTGGIREWDKLESEARAKRVGIWSTNQRVVLPSEYKKEKKQSKARKQTLSRNQ